MAEGEEGRAARRAAPPLPRLPWGLLEPVSSNTKGGNGGGLQPRFVHYCAQGRVNSGED